MKAIVWMLVVAVLAAVLLAACDSLEPMATASPGPVSRVTISSGHSHSCALDEDGRAVCWGDNEHGQASPPTGVRFTAISGGGWHSCGLREDGTSVCWGRNSGGQASPPADERFVAISSGGWHSCALREDGTPVCWGFDSDGQASPPADERFVAISSGGWHSCGLREDGTPVCWGFDSDGQASPPTGVRFVSISVGGWHRCGLREDATPICWGDNEYGQATVPTGERFVAISSGGRSHTCALREDGTPVCWGSNSYGQAEPPAGERFAAISTGWWHTCALREDGTPVCWGSNSYGQASPISHWESVWRPNRWDAGPAPYTSATAAEGRADTAVLYVHCEETLRVAGVWIAFTIDPGSTSRAEATRRADETLDEVYINRRSAGTAGRWMKTGWDHYVSDNGNFVLRTKPAAAFIAQLTEVEEMAVLAKHDYGPDTAAVFDVRFLAAALASPKVGWAC